MVRSKPINDITAGIAAFARASLTVPRRINTHVETWLGKQRTSDLRGVLFFVALASTFSMPAAAQTASDTASSIMCQTGLGALVSIGTGFVVVVLFIAGMFQGALAWMNMGSSSSGKKQTGRDQMKNAAFCFVGMFFFPIAAAVLDRVGINTLSCVDWANVI